VTDATPTPARPDLPHGDLTFNTTPNWLTVVRIGFVPFVIGAMLMRTPAWDRVAAILFGIAGITDIFDGYLARTRKLVTIYGKLLDPLADKLLLTSSYMVFAYKGSIPLWVFVAIFSRDLIIILGWSIIYILTSSSHIEPRLLGKLTTCLQMTAAITVDTINAKAKAEGGKFMDRVEI
jgi:CDP-diacylglycerol--glycerol-3-phosphate 3-phosphatidyltransferase